MQAAQERSFGEPTNRLAFGAEVSRDRFDTDQRRTDAEGNPLTPLDANGNPVTGFSVSRADSTRRFAGLFVQDTFAFNSRWSVAAGIRLDKIRLSSGGRQAFYDFPPPAFTPVLTDRSTGGDRDFSRVTPRLGFNYNPNDATALYAGYSRGFRSPTVIELFAFPIFFSNPDLKPIHSEDWEAGWTQRFGDMASFSLNGFWIDVKDEIFFVLTDPAFFTGENLNLPRTRRRGNIGLPSRQRLNGAVCVTALVSMVYRTDNLYKVLNFSICSVRTAWPATRQLSGLTALEAKVARPQVRRHRTSPAGRGPRATFPADPRRGDGGRTARTGNGEGAVLVGWRNVRPGVTSHRRHPTGWRRAVRRALAVSSATVLAGRRRRGPLRRLGGGTRGGTPCRPRRRGP